MHGATWCTVVCTAVVAVAATNLPGDTSSGEELRQALVLIDILRSGISRQKAATVPPVLDAVLPNSVPWQPPYYDAPFYTYGRRSDMASQLAPFPSYGVPFRRFYGGAEGRVLNVRRSENATRQLEYDDPFGPAPGQIQESTTVQPSISSSTMTAPETTIVKSTTTTITPSITPATKTSKTTTARETEKSIIKSIKNAEVLTTKSESSTSTGKKQKLNYIKPDQLQKKVGEDKKTKIIHNESELEISQAAEEMKQEAADVKGNVYHRYVTIKSTHPTPSDMVSFPWRFRGTTRVYLSRSSRPPIPLPANNAFCHTNPESTLCRTFI